MRQKAFFTGAQYFPLTKPVNAAKIVDAMIPILNRKSMFSPKKSDNMIRHKMV